jgi:hypothetical protein
MALKTNGIPNAEGLFRGLAQAPIHFQNMVAELVDNALAATPTNAEVWIDLSPEGSGGLFRLSVSDNGPGISLAKLQNEVLTLGFPPDSGSHLNEHGFGLKNVLSKVERLTTKPWIFRTRDLPSMNSGYFFECQRPLAYEVPIAKRPSVKWPSKGAAATGTVIDLLLPMTYLQTVAAGRRGAYPTDLDLVMEYLREHLGVFYRGYLQGGIRASAKIFTSTSGAPKEIVDPVEPKYSFSKSYPIAMPAKGGPVAIDCEIGMLDKNSAVTMGRRYYYRHAPESQGVDIRIGKRVVSTRLISEIWELERHPSLNGVAGEIRIPATEGLRIPTLNNKTSLDYDSAVWHSLVQRIRAKVPEKSIPKGGGLSEEDLREELYKHIKGLSKPGDVVERQYNCGSGVYADIVWIQKSRGKDSEIFEVKKGQAQPLDVYQLAMYWDALVAGGTQPTLGHLVSAGATPGVRSFLTSFAKRKDTNGARYDLVQEDWSTHGIST